MRLLDYAKTERQRAIIEAYERLGSATGAATELGLDGGSTRAIIRKIKAIASKQGWAPENQMVHPVPETHKATRITTVYRNGEATMQYVRAEMDNGVDQKAELDSVIAAFKEELDPYKATLPPESTQADRCNAYIITDYHMGMLADKKETGDDWNLEIAESLLVDWFASAIELSPDSEEGLFVQLGDFCHWDGHLPVTPQHGHILDAACRSHDMVAASARVLRRVCDMLLAKHERVRVIMATGNHDIYSSIWMRELVNHVYANEPRLTVDMNPDVYYGYQFGKTALFFHHGHKKKIASVADVFTRKFRKIFGDVEHVYAHTGHLHHIDVKENNLMVVEQHRTLAAADAHAALGGWLSGRSANVITYHREYGEVCRYTLSSDMVAKTLDIG